MDEKRRQWHKPRFGVFPRRPKATARAGSLQAQTEISKSAESYDDKTIQLKTRPWKQLVHPLSSKRRHNQKEALVLGTECPEHQPSDAVPETSQHRANSRPETLLDANENLQTLPLR
jgi:hypothetical protein